MHFTVSVIIPVYNPGLFLERTLRSVLSQTAQDIEIILIDDGSPEVITLPEDIRGSVALVHQPNMGQSMARHRGAEMSRGRYLAFLDQDDLWLPDKLAKQIDYLEMHPEAPACHTQFSFINADDNVVAPGYGCTQSFEQMLAGSSICGASSVLIRRDVYTGLGGFRKAFEPVEDYDLWLRVSKTYGPIAFLPDVLTRYRVHSANQSLQYRRNYRAIRKTLATASQNARPWLRAKFAASVGRRAHKRNAGSMALNAARSAVPFSKDQFTHLFWSFAYATCNTTRSCLKSGIRKVVGR